MNLMKKTIIIISLILFSITSYSGSRTYAHCAQRLFSCADGTSRPQDTSKTLRSCIQQFRGCYLSVKINKNKVETKKKRSKRSGA